MANRALSQEEIDRVFRSLRESNSPDDPARKEHAYDFRRPDQIGKDQLRAIHLLHENFARSLGSSLSAFLRAYVMVNLASVEQFSFIEFSQGLPSPTCLVSLGMRPYDGNAVLELNPGLVFPVLEMLLGGSGRYAAKLNREITEIEQSILEGLIRIILHDLEEAWRPVANIKFTIEGQETVPQLLRVLAPNEAVVAVSLEVRIGDSSGMMNLGIPSIIIKMLRQKFDQQWTVRRTQVTEDDRNRMLRLIKPARLDLDARLEGPTLSLGDLMRLQRDDVLLFDYAVERPVNLAVNGKIKYQGQMVNAGQRIGFMIRTLYQPSE